MLTSDIGWTVSSLWPGKSNRDGSVRWHSSAATTHSSTKKPSLKIGIVGGGIMGITVAHSLIESISKNPSSFPKLEIVIMEADHQGGNMSEFNQNKEVPAWNAATARNANTIAVGASMHVFSTRPMVYSLLSNGIKGGLESLQQQIFGPSSSNTTTTTTSMEDLKTDSNHSNPELFAKPPPFFAFKPYYCLGPPATWNERLAFLNFGLHFWYTALMKGGKEDAKSRAQTLVQLAKATRHKFVTEIAPELGCTSNWYSQGLLSVHRTEQGAQDVLDECHEHGLPAEHLSWEEAIEREPRLGKLPIGNLHAVLRSQDIAANCEQYTRLLLDKCQKQPYGNVQYSQGKVTRIEYAKGGGYTVQQEYHNGESSLQLDVLVLAAGAQTPLLLAQSSLGGGATSRRIPTYPLRGFSYTVVTSQFQRWGHSTNTNLLQSAIAMDNLYMSSVKPWMARLTGFGELAGFFRRHEESRPKHDEVQEASSKAPAVLTRYAKALFQDIAPDKINIADETAIPCLRPQSPDDLPIVGALDDARRGLFVHTGHGTLGWTTAFATADCCAQEILEYVTDYDDDDDGNDGQALEKPPFVLPDGSLLERKKISPSRFDWFASSS
ncbi:MAG: hypothetical protein SGBAC_013409 [Bacillariaceae sp.]